MSMTELLKAVLPDEGWYCIVGLKLKGTPRQTFHETLDAAEAEATKLLGQEYDVYFACSKYATNTSRTQTNAKYMKAFWLDIDCGAGKDYPDQLSGLEALQGFCKTIGIPKPTIVNSGRGIHAYWRLSKTITAEEWKPVAERLKYLCTENEFFVDASRTSDSASILRIPGTLNFKDTPPKPVSIMAISPEVDYEQFKNKLGVLIAPPELGLPKAPLNELTKALANNEEKWFKVIMTKTIKGEGCAQLAKIATEQDTVDYNLWRAGLSVAWACEDRDEAIHKISQGHPDYDYESTIRKAMDTGGPQRCSTFEKFNPSGCEECAHRGKIAGPIALGKRIVRHAGAAPSPVEAEKSSQNLAAELGAQSPTSVALAEQDISSVVYPYPYFRGKTGGVYLGVDEDDEPALIYQHDLYVVKRLWDPGRGEVAWLRLRLPKDGIREFALPLTDLMTREKLREKLGWHGVAVSAKPMDAIMQYVIKFVNELQYKAQLEVMRMQFGWADDNRKFIIGDQEITAEGTRYSPPSSVTLTLSEYMQPKGTLEEWKKIANVYDREGFEPHAFGFFSAFGSPLLKHLNLHGAIINLINNRSGTGKTTIIHLMHSVYGHPEEQLLMWRDTMNMKLNRLGVMNNLPGSCDEVTKMEPNEFSDFLYAISQGRARGRLQSQSNQERINNSKWSLICVTTSNASFYDKLNSLSSSPDGEMMRLIEYQIPETSLISKAEADEIFPLMFQNYGHAGRVYLQWLVANLEDAVDLVHRIQIAIDKSVKFTGRERFWSGVAACNIAGAMIAKKLGIIDIDVKRVFDWLVKELSQIRQEIKPPVTTHTSIIGEFLNEHRSNILVINDAVDNRSGLSQLPIVDPKYELLARIEPDTKKLFISAKHLRKFCSTNRITLNDTLKALESEGVYEKRVKKRMAKGTNIEGLPTDTFMFDCSKGDFIDTDIYINVMKQDGDSRDQL